MRSRLKRAPFGIALNDADMGDSPALFTQACAMGLEGIVSKRANSRYRSGRSSDWLKSKNPASPAVRREAEEDSLAALSFGDARAQCELQLLA